MIEQQTVKVIDTQKNIWDHTTEELKIILGDFRREYHEATTGMIVHNNILGYVHDGNVKHALRIGAITELDGHYFVKLPEYRDYDLKLRALGELISRKEYAYKKNIENLIN